MDVDKPSGGQGTWRAYAATVGSCAIFLGLTGLAFQINADLVVSPSAQSEALGERRGFGLMRALRLPALPAEPSSMPGPRDRDPKSAAPKPPALVVLSRAPDDGHTGAAGPEELPSPDTDETASTEPWSPERADTFRTVCVRLCDGASFPISFATTRDRFKMDAARCQAGCGSPARLFIGPPDGQMADLADLKGNAYSALPNAFKYQTAYDPACTCRGQPWENAERERHKALAEAATAEALRPKPPVAMATVPAQSAKVSANIEIVALRSREPSRAVAPVEPARLQASKAGIELATGPATAITAVEAAAPRKQQRKNGRVAGKGAKAPTAQKFSDPFQTVFGVAPLKSAKPPKAVDTSMQRPFKPKEYWRLSYWEVTN